MPKTQYFTAASLDGYIADSDNSLDWLFQAEATAKAESASGDLYYEFCAQVGALAMGATTYEWVLRHEKLLDKPGSWPYSGRRCWVFSHRQLPAVPGADISKAPSPLRWGPSGPSGRGPALADARVGVRCGPRCYPGRRRGQALGRAGPGPAGTGAAVRPARSKFAVKQ